MADPQADHQDDLHEKLKKAQEEAQQETNEQELSKTDQLQEELEKMTETAKRAMADMQNLKRRMEEERFTIFANAKADFIKQILPILDNLERALSHTPKEAKEWAKGLEMSVNQLEKVFEDAGLTKMETTGQPFDPALHEALMQSPGEQNIITEELEAGYQMGDRVVRHAKVKVGNGQTP
ncbi:nucleotide exchange factor GrpE [Patescibacteria group bacterium]|nr:nucleotide exchange factor GrpE [Patescibacteria group bacterium]